MAASSSGVGEGILADKEVELAGVHRVQKGKLTDLSKVARGSQTTGRFLFVHFLCGRPGAKYLKCTMSLYFTAIPEVETIISMLETGSSVVSFPALMPLCQDVLVECTTYQALGKGPDAHFLHKSGVRTVSSILQMRLLLGKVFSPPFRSPNLGSPILTL